MNAYVVLFSILSVVCVAGMFAGTVMISRGVSGHLLAGCSAIGMLFFGAGAVTGAYVDQRDTRFNKTRELILPLMSVKFDHVCDRSGPVLAGDARPNCLEKDGFRIWRDQGRLYVASLVAGGAFTDLIVDEDRLLGGYYNSIIHLSEELDLQRLSWMIRGRPFVGAAGG